MENTTETETKSYTVEDLQDTATQRKIIDFIEEQNPMGEIYRSDIENLSNRTILDIYNDLVGHEGDEDYAYNVFSDLHRNVYTEYCEGCDDNYRPIETFTETQSVRLCSNCIDNFIACALCEQYVYEEATYTLNDREFCHHCYEITMNAFTGTNIGMAAINPSITQSRTQPDIQTRSHSAELIGDITETGETIKSTRAYSAEIEFYSTDNHRLLPAINKMPRAFGIGYDGSLGRSQTADGRRIYTALEVQTSILAGKEGEQLLSDTLDSFAEAGGYVDRTCGLHIHLDMAHDSQSVDIMKRLFVFHYVFERVIQSFLPKERRVNNYCKPLSNTYSLNNDMLSAKSVLGFAKGWYMTSNEQELRSRMRSHRDNTRYSGLNLHTLLWQGHVEIRFHSGTLNSRKVLEWINLHARILDFCSGLLDKPVTFGHRAQLPDISNVFVDEKECPSFALLRAVSKEAKEYDAKNINLLRELTHNTPNEVIDTGRVYTGEGWYDPRDAWNMKVDNMRMLSQDELIIWRGYREKHENVNRINTMLRQEHATLIKSKQDKIKSEIELRELEIKQELKGRLDEVPTVGELKKLYDEKSIETLTAKLFDLLKLSDESRKYFLSRQEKFQGQADYEESELEFVIKKDLNESVTIVAPVN